MVVVANQDWIPDSPAKGTPELAREPALEGVLEGVMDGVLESVSDGVPEPRAADGSGPRAPRSETIAVPQYVLLVPKIKNRRDIASYFEYSNHGIEVVQEGLEEIPFGEFLVAENALTRYQLFRALQLQDQPPHRRIGECIAALGYLTGEQIKDYLRKWNGLDVVVVGTGAETD
jgi:hypothetical protein